MNRVLNMLGLCRKAGRLELGEVPALAAVKARSCKLLVLAADAADNTARRAGALCQANEIHVLTLRHTKEEFGAAMGRASCALGAVTAPGLAAAVLKALDPEDREKHAPTIEHLDKMSVRRNNRRRKR